jgi:hypothetical protein
MMAIAFKTKKAAKEAVPFGPEKVIETSLFGPQFKDGQHAVVVSLEPDRVRNSFATITVKDGLVVAVK